MFPSQTAVTESQTQTPPEFVEVSPLVQSESKDLAHSPVSDESSGYISTSVSTATLSDTPVTILESNLDPEAQEAFKPSHKLEPEGDVEDKEVQMEPGKTAECPRTENARQENATTMADSKTKTDISDEKFRSSLSERSAFASSSSTEYLLEMGPSVEPKEPVPLTVTQPCQLTSQTSPAAAVKEEQAPPTQQPTSNPFKIQKVKTSGLKSFKGILQEVEQELDKEGVDPLEKLEILSDTEEGHEERALPDWLKEDEYITVGSNKNGTVRYIGPTDFADGIWVGVELDVPAGTLCVCWYCSSEFVSPHFHLFKEMLIRTVKL